MYFFLKERVEPLEQRPRLLTGDDLIQELNLKPGPEFRQYLTAVDEAALEGRIQNRNDAMALVEGLLQEEAREKGRGKKE